MIKLDHLTVIAPTLEEGVAHVEECLGLQVPFGTRHDYMGTWNHRLQLGGDRYLEIVAHDPRGVTPKRSRWFGLDNPAAVRSDWDRGRRLRGWVASTSLSGIADRFQGFTDLFGEVVSLPPERPEFGFTIKPDGSLPMDGALPSLIDHRDAPTSMAEIPDLGARLVSFSLRHPEPDIIQQQYKRLECFDPPQVIVGAEFGYHATIETPSGLRELH